MNNKVFISGKITGDRNYRSKFEQACMDVSRPEFFDRYGSAKLSYKYGFFGFYPVAPATSLCWATLWLCARGACA